MYNIIICGVAFKYIIALYLCQLYHSLIKLNSSRTCICGQLSNGVSSVILIKVILFTQ